MKYRVKGWTVSYADDFFIAQYKILGMWLNINDRQKGMFTKNSRTFCETYEDAIDRVELHIKNMKRAKSWAHKYSHILWED